MRSAGVVHPLAGVKGVDIPRPVSSDDFSRPFVVITLVIIPQCL
ncbi:MAG: hypothetical protein U0586_00525 [Candidatus Brocadiaceae bacterium]